MENFKVTITEKFGGGDCFSGGVRILFVLEGKVRLELPQNNYLLEKEDFVIINRNRICRIKEDSKYLLAVIEADYRMLQNLSGKNIVYLHCNSAVEEGVKYEKFRYLIGELLNEYAVDYANMTFLKVSSFYKLCHYMIMYFSSAEWKNHDEKAGRKIEEAMCYLESHYT